MALTGRVQSEEMLVREERDLFLQLLNLGRQNDLPQFLQEALGMIVGVTQAVQCYLALFDEDDAADAPRWWIAHGLSPDEIQGLHAAISRGIIAEALATGQTIVTACAQSDPRFSSRESVRAGRIMAVLCVPIGEDPPRGVLYLQGRAAPGAFSEADRARAELCAEHLAPLVDRLLSLRRAQEDGDPTRSLRESLRLDGVIGHSAALAATLRQVGLVAPLDVSVLLTGETGSGKSQIARIIHDSGPRANQPFVELNCAALPDNLIESELFGAVKGAHSTATHPIIGKVAAAEHGTLFLDEVGELTAAAQTKLLQLLQSKVYYPLGSAKAERADVRIIAATNQDLKLAVTERRFREDLFYRLQVLPIRVPSLAERPEDIPELMVSLAAGACDRNRLPQLTVSRGAIRAAQSAEWRGNIRELANGVEAAVIRAAGSGALQVERDHLFPNQPPAPDEADGDGTFQEATRRFHERLVRETLERTGWNVAETARRLDLARSHLYSLIRTFGIERERR